jgi:hypothetical protein
MGFDKNYPVKIPSNQIKPKIQTRLHHTINSVSLRPFPFFITGLTDAFFYTSGARLICIINFTAMFITFGVVKKKAIRQFSTKGTNNQLSLVV